MIRFNFFDAELLNSFFEGCSGDVNKTDLINRIESAITNTDDPELLQCAQDTLSKIKTLDDVHIQKLISSLPIYDGYSL